MRPAAGAGRSGATRSAARGRRPAGATEASREELSARLDAVVEALGLGPRLDADDRDRLLDYLELLARWNRSFNLTAIRDPRARVAAHLADSLSIVPLLDSVPAGGRVVDVGSGAGLPGIPLAIARPDLCIELVEPVGKKAAFLRQCRAELALDRVEVRECRVEALSLDAEPDLVVSRAFASLADFAAAAAAIAGRGTRLLAMKGARPDAEIEELEARGLPWRVAAIESLDVPGLDARRCAVILETRRNLPLPNPTEP